MTKILFVCHGNICRSPTAEFYMKDLVKKAGLEREFEIASAAAHCDALGDSVYPSSRRMLTKHGIDCSGKTARLMLKEDYEHYDLLIGMDEANIRDMRRIAGGDPRHKLHTLLEFAGRPGAPVADPWYTRDFEKTWLDICAGCQGLLEKLRSFIILDFSNCRTSEELYDVMRSKMSWEDWYGNNLDALYDVLTGFPQKSSQYLLIMPELSAPRELREYADKVYAVFAEAREEML